MEVLVSHYIDSISAWSAVRPDDYISSVVRPCCKHCFCF